MQSAKKITTYVCSLLLVVGYALLMNKRVSTMMFHEIVGLCVAALTLVHLVLHWNCIWCLTKSIFKKRLPLQTLLAYAIDVVLLIAMAYVVWGGVLISKSLFPSFHASDYSFWKILHVSLSLVLLLAAGIHIGLCWKAVMARLRNWCKVSKISHLAVWIQRVIVIGILAFGIQSLTTTNFIPKISAISILFDAETWSSSSQQQSSNNNNEEFSMQTNGEQQVRAHGEGRQFRGGRGDFQENKNNSERNGVGKLPQSRGVANPWLRILQYFSIFSSCIIVVHYLSNLGKRQKV